MLTDLIQTSLLQGLILALIAYGMMIPFRLLNFPDLTAEGAYPLGGALTASLLTLNVSPIFALLLSIGCAGVMAIATAQVCMRFKINSLLAGIILSTMVYSVMLRIMGKPNIALFEETSFDLNIITLFLILLACLICLTIFLKTDFGLRLRAVGLNPKFATKQGICMKRYTCFGLLLAGSLYGLAGSLMVHIQHYMDIGMGVGIVIHGLASLMIGEAIVGNHTLKAQLMAPLIGAIIYQFIQGVVLIFGLAPTDLKFFTGSVALLVLALKKGEIHAR